MKVCRICGYQGPKTDFHKHNQYKDGYESLCKKCQSKAVGVSKKKYATRVKEYNREYNKKNPDKVKKWREKIAPEKKLLWSARQRAKERKLPCTICEADIIIPATCPILGIQLEKSEMKYSCSNSPSLDCVNPLLGYIPGNIAVISHKANTMKSNASLAELEALVAWLKKQ